MGRYEVKRSLSITLLSVSLGMPAVGVGAAVICKTHSEAYNKFLAKISRPVKRTHKVSKEQAAKFTAYNKAMLAKLDRDWEVLCGSISGVSDEDLRLGADIVGDDVTDSPVPFDGLGYVDQAPGEILLASTELTGYDNPSRNLPMDGGIPYFGGFGYVPVGLPAGYSNGGIGIPSAPPVTVPTPEPMTLALLGTGLLLGWRLKCR